MAWFGESWFQLFRSDSSIVVKTLWGHELQLSIRHHAAWWWSYNSVVYVHIVWVGSADLPKHHWQVTTLFWFISILHPFMDSIYPNHNDGLFQQDNVQCHRLPNVPRTGLRNILEISSKWCGHLIHLIQAQLSIYRTWYSNLFIYKILHLQISGSCEQLSK